MNNRLHTRKPTPQEIQMAQAIIHELHAEWVTVDDIARVASLIARFRDAAYQQGATDATKRLVRGATDATKRLVRGATDATKRLVRGATDATKRLVGGVV